jgi:hypothetical protein
MCAGLKQLFYSRDDGTSFCSWKLNVQEPFFRASYLQRHFVQCVVSSSISGMRNYFDGHTARKSESFGRLMPGSRGSSISLVSYYGLDDRAIDVRSPASVSRPDLRPTQPPVQWVLGVLSPGIKRGRGVTLTTHPHLLPRS